MGDDAEPITRHKDSLSIKTQQGFRVCKALALQADVRSTKFYNITYTDVLLEKKTIAFKTQSP